ASLRPPPRLIPSGGLQVYHWAPPGRGRSYAVACFIPRPFPASRGSCMWLILFRLVAVALLAHAGYFYNPFPGNPALGAVLGAVAAVGFILLELRLRTVPGHQLVGAMVGGVTGLFGARLLWGAMDGLDLQAEDFVHSILIVFLSYMGVVIGARK